MINFKEYKTPWFIDIILSTEDECNKLPNTKKIL